MRSEKYLFRSHGLLVGGLGGGLAGLSLLNGEVFFMWIALAFLWSISGDLFGGFLWGFVAVLISHSWLLALHPLSWIGIPGPLSLPIALMIWLFCGGLGGLLVGLWSWISNTPLFERMRDGFFGEKILFIVVLSSIWGLSEVLLASSPLFWIGVGGSALPSDRYLAGIARWIGEGGLATVQLLIGSWLWQIGIAVRRGIGWKRLFSFGLFFFLLVHLVGASLLPKKSFSEAIPVALWQSDIPIRTKFSEEQQNRIPYALNESFERAKNLSASWLVAPEGILGSNQELLFPAPIPLLSGGFRWVRGAQRSAVLVFQKGERKSSKALDKHRLVPLGEKVPDSLPLFKNGGLSAVGGLEAGSPSRLLSWSGPPVAVAICYELSDGKLLAEAVNSGAKWLLTVANLDPYPISLQRQFLALAQLRSIETSRDLISVANTGPSVLIKASGEVKPIIDPFIEATELAELHLHSDISGYTRWKEMPLISIFLLSFSALIMMRFCSN